jgi:hypothetical protein
MRLSFRRSLFVLALGCALPALANPVLVGPPPVVDGKPVPLPTVKKWGQYWYPASLVGYNRGIEFAFDHATNTLYADGSVLDLDTIVIDGVVYVPLQPQVSSSDLQPGMAMLQARREKYESMEAGKPEKAGRTDMLFMAAEVDVPEHPWAEAPTAQPSGPIIDLDPTGTAHTPTHIQTQAPQVGGPLPNRLPRFAPVVTESPQEAPTAGGIPLRVATQGGPQQNSSPNPTGGDAPPTLPPPSSLPSPPSLSAPGLPPSSSPNGLQPIPVTAVAPAGPQGPSAGGAIGPCKGQNQAFEVSVLGGSLKNSPSDRLLALTLNQKNLSPVAQANLGSFALRCQDGSRIEPVKSRSVMPDGTLAPGGVREGELLFRLGPNAEPSALELEGTLPLSVPLVR